MTHTLLCAGCVHATLVTAVRQRTAAALQLALAELSTAPLPPESMTTLAAFCMASMVTQMLPEDRRVSEQDGSAVAWAVATGREFEHLLAESDYAFAMRLQAELQYARRVVAVKTAQLAATAYIRTPCICTCAAQSPL